MGNPQLHPTATPARMSVNVALCGSIPRSLMHHNGAPCGLQALSSLHPGGFSLKDRLRGDCSVHSIHLLNSDSDRNKNISTRPIHSERQPLSQLFEAPAWAVPAKGEARLEPVCEGLARHQPIDLTQKPLYRVGRSPHCDIQLMHGTSSRRHAMLFHHSNGACYLVDCGSAHGTFVNGQKISSPSNGGVVVPHKVRRGALIRFGGPGAPCFVLKSFSFKLDEIDVALNEKSDMVELIRRNTRLNALGSSVADRLRLNSEHSQQDQLQVCRKRSFDSLVSTATLEDIDESSSKRIRCSSPPMSPEMSLLRLVSPVFPKRHVRFSTDPPQAFYPALVTPEDSLSAEEDNDESSLL